MNDAVTEYGLHHISQDRHPVTVSQAPLKALDLSLVLRPFLIARLRVRNSPPH